jgi:hypothetical protein
LSRVGPFLYGVLLLTLEAKGESLLMVAFFIRLIAN